MKNKTLMLVDADYYLYVSTLEAETEVCFDDGNVQLISNWKQCVDDLSLLFEEMTEMADKVIFCFTSKNNFRYNCLPTYKGNRASRKPLGYYKVQEELMESSFNTKLIDGLEADDVCSILATMPKYYDWEKTILSNDKDLKQVPNVYIQKDINSKPMLNTREEADRFRWGQCLTGDTTDGYKGLKGYGPVKAAKYLKDAEDVDELIHLVFEAYDDAGVPLEDAYAQVDCCCILRADEFNFDTKKPILIERRLDDDIPF